MPDQRDTTRAHPVVQLTLMRLRELSREPGTLFWVFGFPVLISIALGAGIVAFFITIVGVFPTALWLLKRRTVTLPTVFLFGLGFGNLPVVLGTVLSGGSGPAGLLRAHAFGSLLGVTGAAVFWLVSVRGVRDAGSPAAR